MTNEKLAGCGVFDLAKSPERARMSTNFGSTLTAFCSELRLTFPELAAQIDRAATYTAERFWIAWKSHLHILLDQSADALFEERSGLLIGPVQMTPALWSELSDNTRIAIWKYLRTLALEAAMSQSLEGMETETMQLLMNIMTAVRLDGGGEEADAATSEMFAELQPMMDRLKSMMGNFVDLSGDAASVPLPEIPERLRNGRIAKMAEEMAKQFNPSDFGIDPAVLAGDNVEEILKRLAELYQRDPTLLIAGAKRVAEKIKKQILGGSLDREAILAEAQEFVELFKEHPLFKEAIGKFQSLMGEGGLASMFGGEANAGAPSERRRAVQERLRAKLEARRKGKK